VRASLGGPSRDRRGRQAGRDEREEHAEIKRLKAENKRLREDVEILRAATTFFVGELDPRNR
jgi:transposase-like protein